MRDQSLERGIKRNGAGNHSSACQSMHNWKIESAREFLLCLEVRRRLDGGKARAKVLGVAPMQHHPPSLD